MSKSARAQEKRRKRGKLSKYQRDKLTKQHFGDKYVYRGRPLLKGQSKRELIDAEAKGSSLEMGR